MALEKICDASGFTRVTNGRFRGGWITRRCGNPSVNIHAVQMELAMQGFLHEPQEPLTRSNWPQPIDDALAARLRVALRDVLGACVAFANARRSPE
jgi:formiminoglutamase